MKKIKVLVCSLFLSIFSIYSQSPLETEYFNQLNIYRKQHGLGPLKYDTEVSGVARYHAKYLIQCSNLNHVIHLDELPHDEQFDLKDHRELNFEQRAAMVPRKNIWGEIQIAFFIKNKNATISDIAKGFIDSFDKSPKHKEIMLCEDVSSEFTNIVGVAIVKSEKKIGDNDVYSINVDFGVLINQVK